MLAFYLHLTDKEVMVSDMESDVTKNLNNWYSYVSYPDLVNSKSEQFSIMLHHYRLNLCSHVGWYLIYYNKHTKTWNLFVNLGIWNVVYPYGASLRKVKQKKNSK